MITTSNITELRRLVEESMSAVPEHARLAGISGIDASGKGYIASRLAEQLQAAGRRIALINVDGWLNLPQIRFLNRGTAETGQTSQGYHFYRHGLRLDEMFEQLILPLKERREISLTIDFAEETASEFRPHTYGFSGVDTILLEGIFIFKREFVRHFDLKVWIECTFETALSRAVARGQEALPESETIASYNNIYFPAQRVHFDLDAPRRSADIVFINDS